MKDTLLIDEPNTVFRNSGRAGSETIHLSALTSEAGFTAIAPARHRGSAIGDFNHDGKLDIVVTALGAPAEIWINRSDNHNHWLELSLEGTRSNRDGIGSRLRIITKAGTQYNYVSSASGYASSSAGPAHFGLGAQDRIESVEIRWPSGTVQILRDVMVDQILKVKEPR